MFSPYYARARRRTPGGAADPLDHCALNVVLYGRGGSRWAMTERGRAAVQRDARTLRIGPSALHWHGDTLTIDIDEVGVPWPARLRGRVTLRAAQCFGEAFGLAPGHRWQPIAPAARVEVALGPVRWSGPGYLDANSGAAPLESAFRRWDWSRALLPNGDAIVLYDLDRHHGGAFRLGLRLRADGRIASIETPPSAALPRTAWRLARSAHADRGTPIQSLQTLTDAPFYARSLMRTCWLGEPVTVMHESLSLTRFDSAWVQAMLPFRMPRRRH